MASRARARAREWGNAAGRAPATWPVPCVASVLTSSVRLNGNRPAPTDGREDCIPDLAPARKPVVDGVGHRVDEAKR